MTALAEVRNSGLKPLTATRVAGKEPLKIRTPSRPLPHPAVIDFIVFPFFRCVGHSGTGLVRTATNQYNFDKLYWLNDSYTSRQR